MKKLFIFAAAAFICLWLMGCGAGSEAPAETAAPAPTAAPTALPTPAETNAAETEPPTAEPPTAEPAAGIPALSGDTVPGGAGSYTYTAPEGVWTLTLRDSGPYTLQKEGEPPHTGEAWAVNEDGSVSCGPTDLWNESFADRDGCTNWVFYPGGVCAPIFPG